MLHRLLLASVVVAGLVPGLALAQGSSPSGNRPPTTGAVPPGSVKSLRQDPDSVSPVSFVEKAMQGSHFEILAGRLAGDRAQSSSVKSLAETIVRDHERALERLRAAAEAEGIKTLDEPVLSAEQQNKLNRLRDARGADFERLYTRLMEEDHERDIRDFREFSVSGESAKVAQAARDLLPILEKHLQHTEALAQR